MSTGSTLTAGTGKNSLGFVIIGRNEGERLKRCLESIQGEGPIVYVDSGSNDGSAVVARSLGAYVVNLDMGIPFTAARARNVGFEKLIDLQSGLKYVHFIDGDCEIVGGWIQHAIGILEQRHEVAAISGRVREKSPHASIYNRLADLEWERLTGDVESCMGCAIMRISSYQHVGGFNSEVGAGEVHELCARLRGKEYKIVQVPDTMAMHDMAMLQFAQWWNRTARSGYASWDVYERTGLESAKADLDSSRLWGIGWPMLLIVLGMGAFFVPWWISAPAIFAALMIGPIQAIRIALMLQERGMAFVDAWAYGALALMGNFAALRGQWLYMVDRENKQASRLMETKGRFQSTATSTEPDLIMPAPKKDVIEQAGLAKAMPGPQTADLWTGGRKQAGLSS